jgi:DNA gyrase subunit A
VIINNLQSKIFNLKSKILNMLPEEQIIPAIPVNIDTELQTSYLDYAMSVIVGRALPDVRDGLKPVHRRVLYTMYEMGLDWNKPFKKSARIVGDCMGKYHPHGDAAIYDTLVRMEQEFSLRYPLVDGQGNFGSVDGDNPAAMRYTEARRAKISQELLLDIDKETVDFTPNYDDSLVEPEILPAKLPNLLLNGSEGIAVGMATKIPPHNLGEVIDGLIWLMDHPAATMEELHGFVKGPDFPTGGIIYGHKGIADTYRTGRGLIQVRARVFVEKDKRGERDRMIVTEIPYQVNKAKLIEKIADLVKEKTIEGIADLRDESDRDGMRIVIELKRGEVAEVILNQLYKHTQMQVTFGAIMLALVDQRPRCLTLKEIMEFFLKHRREIIVRRSRYLLRKAEDRAHIVEGLLIALDHIDAVIQLIRSSQTPQIAADGLMTRFGLSEIQARAILDMRLQRLTGLEREKLDQEYQELRKEIDYFRSLLADPNLVSGVIKEELLALKAAYGDERRTEIVAETTEITLEDMIVDEDMVVMITHGGYIKRNPVAMYRSQQRRGKGVTGIIAKEEDVVEHLFVASTHTYILVFTDRGKVYWLKVYEIPEAGRQAKGKAIINLIQVDSNEKVSAILPVREFEAGKYIMMATRRGVVKKTELTEFSNPRSNGIIALTIAEGDELMSVVLTDGQQDVLLCTLKGKSIRFSETDVRSMGRTAMGVRGISLRKDDCLIGMDVVHNEFTILTVTEKGYGKRSPVDAYRLQGRGGKGIINIKCTPKRGNVIGMLQVTETDDIVMIASSGKILRMAVANIKVIGRNTQGVALQWLSDDDKMVAVARVLESGAEEDEEE